MPARRKWLRVSPDLRLPALDTQTGTIVVYGGKDMGKTNFGSVVVEELSYAGLRFSWIDPVGVAYGLKHSSDGKGKGISVLILGGVHGDLPIHPESGSVVADLVVDEHVSVIIDISRYPDGRMWKRKEKIIFVRDYMERLYARQGERRRPIMQVIDECGRFCPEISGSLTKQEHILECRTVIEEVVELGRNVGIGVLLMTQRSARMAKSVSELAEMMVSFRIVGPRSIGSIIDWFGDHVPKEKQRELIERIRQLDKGTAMVVSPGWLKVEGEYHMRARETFDSSATPKAGKERRPTGKGATVDLSKYRKRMSEITEQAERENPKHLLKENAKLQARIKDFERHVCPHPVTETKEVRVEVPVFSKEDREVLDRIILAVDDVVRDTSNSAKQVQSAISEFRDALADRAKQPQVRVSQKADAVTMPDGRVFVGEPSRGQTTVHRSEVSVSSNGQDDIPKAERAIMTVLAQHGASAKSKVALKAGYSSKGGYFANTLSALRTKKWIVGGTKQRPLIEITMEGADALGTWEPLPTGPELLDYWCRQPEVGKAGRVILRVVAGAYPSALPKDQVAEEAGYEAGGGYFANTLSKLRTLGLIQGMQEIQLSPDFAS